jgi:hypothetical protein
VLALLPMLLKRGDAPQAGCFVVGRGDVFQGGGFVMPAALEFSGVLCGVRAGFEGELYGLEPLGVTATLPRGVVFDAAREAVGFLLSLPILVPLYNLAAPADFASSGMRLSVV